jgi:hypothetical protein
MFVSCVCCVLCRQRPLRRADNSFRGVLLCVCVCVFGCVCVCVWVRLTVSDLETSTMGRPRSELDCRAKELEPLFLYNFMV